MLNALDCLSQGDGCQLNFTILKLQFGNLIQTAINETGFIIAQVNKLDKGSTTILADIRPGAAVQDLIISCYKPSKDFEKKIQVEHQDVIVWDFVTEHLNHLPVHIKKGNNTSAIIERTPKLLFDRLITYYLMRSLLVPINTNEFQEGLKQRFVEDGMYFTAGTSC